MPGWESELAVSTVEGVVLIYSVRGGRSTIPNQVSRIAVYPCYKLASENLLDLLEPQLSTYQRPGSMIVSDHRECRRISEVHERREKLECWSPSL
jgi:hypothetical protein